MKTIKDVSKTDTRINAHWTNENYRQTVTKSEVQSMLVYYPTIIFKGRMHHMKHKSLGAGIYEIFKGKRISG